MDDELDLVLSQLPPIAGAAPGILDDIWDVIQGLYRLVTDPAATIVTPIAEWVRVALFELYTFEKILFEPHLLPETIAARIWSIWGLPIPTQIGHILWLLAHRIIDPIIGWFRDVKEHVTARVIGIRDDIYDWFRNQFARGYEFERERLWGWIPDWAQYHFPPVSPDTSLWAYIGRLIMMPPFAVIGTVIKVRDATYDWFTGHFARGYEFELDRIGYLIPEQWRGHFPRPSPDTSMWAYIGRLIMLPPVVLLGQATQLWQSFYSYTRDSYLNAYNRAINDELPNMTDREKELWPLLPPDTPWWTALFRYLTLGGLLHHIFYRRTGDKVVEQAGDIKDFIQHDLIDPLGDWTKSILDAVAEPGKRVWGWFSERLQSIWERITEWWGSSLKPKLQGVIDWFKDLGGEIKDALLGPLDDILTAHSPVSIEDSFHLGKRVLLAGVAGVVGTGAMFTALELAHPLKQMGLGKLAEIYFGAMNYQAITGAYIMPLTYAAIRNPVQMYFNRMFRTGRPSPGDSFNLRKQNLITKDDFDEVLSYSGYPQGWIDALAKLAKTYPALPDLEMMYAKKETTPEQFERWMRWWGYDDEMLEVYKRYLWMDPRLTELIRIAQLYRPPTHPEPQAVEWLRRAGIPLTDPDAWWFTYKIAKAGYEPIDIPILTEVAKLGVVRREQTLFFSSAQRLFRDGYITEAKVKELTATAWVAKPPIEYRLMAVELDRDYALKEETVGLLLAAFIRGILDESEAIGLMADLGMDVVRIALRIMRAKLGLIAPVRIEVPREEEIVFAGE